MVRTGAWRALGWAFLVGGAIAGCTASRREHVDKGPGSAVVAVLEREVALREISEEMRRWGYEGRRGWIELQNGERFRVDCLDSEKKIGVAYVVTQEAKEMARRALVAAEKDGMRLRVIEGDSLGGGAWKCVKESSPDLHRRESAQIEFDRARAQIRAKVWDFLVPPDRGGILPVPKGEWNPLRIAIERDAVGAFGEVGTLEMSFAVRAIERTFVDCGCAPMVEYTLALPGDGITLSVYDRERQVGVFYACPKNAVKLRQSPDDSRLSAFELVRIDRSCKALGIKVLFISADDYEVPWVGPPRSVDVDERAMQEAVMALNQALERLRARVHAYLKRDQ